MIEKKEMSGSALEKRRVRMNNCCLALAETAQEMLCMNGERAMEDVFLLHAASRFVQQLWLNSPDEEDIFIDNVDLRLLDQYIVNVFYDDKHIARLAFEEDPTTEDVLDALGGMDAFNAFNVEKLVWQVV